ncbi:MAG: hypothetical protein QOF28_1832 [Actinomycetota bacterium]|nr:hypothetical protein [Actinomycetota bacterium]
MSREATERRLRDQAVARLEPGETIVVWCRAWVSKARSFQRLAPRWRDVAVVTDRRLLLFGVGHFTRRPRRRVLVDRLDELILADVGAHPGRGLRCTRHGRADMLLELGNDPWSRRFVQELQERAGRPAKSVAPSAPVEPPAPAAPPDPPAPPPPKVLEH